MYTRVLNFIKYNNAFTILLALFFFGFGISFAAEPAVRDSLYSSQQTVVSIDNGYIVSTDLQSYNFNLKINAITEDEKNYYATYSYQTIQIIDNVWQNKQVEKTLTVSKEELEGKDLGLYLAKQLGENINYELSYLQKVQKIEKEKGESQKVITTEYSGLIGKLLNPKQEVIEGYNPVIPEVIPEIPVTVEENPQEVIVSTQYPRQETIEPTIEQTPAEQTPSNTPPQELSTDSTSGGQESLSQTSEDQTPSASSVQAPSINSAQASVEEPATEPTSTVNEELIQEVVEVLLKNKEPAPTSHSELDSESTSSVVTPTESIIPPTSTTEVTPDSEIQ